ncbi:DUF7344 domain-containing protein [Haloarcula litorea]|uniref:DUF7344 domain-containing protein n=1 Tax=Haloarcula litorea TaxID=3032579 RepID=UPI0023E7C855|nr:hypothetical protein [Halomicroarcula sp. GDY20]
MTDPEKRSGQTCSGGGSGDVAGLADDRLYRALASTRRRRLLYVLLADPDHDRTVEELAAILTGWEATTGGMATPDDYNDVRIGLRHADLPILADSGLIDFDPETGTVTLEPIPEPVAALVRDAVADRRDQ